MLEWEEHTFLGIKSLYERFVTRPRERAADQVRVRLGDHRQRLFLLAQMAAGRPVFLFETDERVLCDHERIFLPAEFSLADSREANLAFYEIKTILAGLVIEQGWFDESTLLDRFANRVESFPHLAAKMDETAAAFESPEDFYEALGEVRSGSDVAVFDSVERVHPDSLGKGEEEDDDVVLTEIEGRGQLDVTSEADREDDGPGHETPIHTFEKAETLEEHTGLSRRTDKDDELEDHEEALREVNMSHVLRSRDRPTSIYRADVLMESVALEADESAAEGGIPYPEWDFKKRRYREDWCRVHESEVGAGDSSWIADAGAEYGGLVLALRKKLARFANQYLRAKRQPAGAEFDLDALVESRVAWHSGRTPDENIYLEKKRQLHDVAALVLLDRSWSTDGFIDGRRVLEIIRDTMFCAGEVLDEFLETFAVAAFSSDTRHHCAFDWVKGFDDSWAGSRARLGEVRASGYTRIGPALRHAHEQLKRRPAERRVVILITDGRPCDYDRYEGTYGVQDVKRAIATGKAHGIDTHAFAIETRARETFPAMFTRDHYHIVPKPEELTTGLCELFARLRS